MSGSSCGEHRPFAHHHYTRTEPATVIDVGPGQGIYASSLRDLHAGHWTGVEIHEPYVDRFGLGALYDEIVVADGFDYLADHTADLVILGDVVEHLPFDQGTEMIRRAMRSRSVLLSIPLGVYEQGPIDGNDHEAHLSTWFHADVIGLLAGNVDYRLGEVVGTYWWEAPCGS